MTNKELDQKIRAAFAEATPDVLGSVLADCKKQPKPVIQFSSPMANWGKKFTLTVAAAALVVCLSLGWNAGWFGVEPTVPTGPLQTGTQPSTHPTEHDSTDPTSVSLSVDMDMTASWLKEDGTVAENFSMTVNGTIDIKDDSPTYLNLNIALPQDFPYIFKIPELNEYITVDRWAYWPGDFASVCYCYYANDNAAEMVAWAVNTEKEYFIACWKSEPGRYLVASVDPEVKPAEILEHFVLFADLHMPYDPEPTEPSEPEPSQPTEPSAPTEPEPTEPEFIIPDQFPDDLITDKTSLATFQRLFDRNEWFRHALCLSYDDPRNMSLHRFFYDSTIVDERGISDEDRAAIVAKTGVEAYYDRKAYRLSAKTMDAVLNTIFGISLDEIDEGCFYSLHYLESNGDYCYFDNGEAPVSKVNVLGIRILENDNTEVYYSVLKGWGTFPIDYGVLTLRNFEKGYQVLSHHDVVIWPIPGQVPQIPEDVPDDLITDEEVVLNFQRLFYNDSWYTQALLEEYDDPRNIKLSNFLFDSCKPWSFKHLTLEERNEMAELLGVDVREWGDITAMKEATMEEVVQKVFGISLADFTDSAKKEIRYLESTDYYYFGDCDSTTVILVTVAGVRELANGNIEVYYTASGPGPMEGVVTLKPVDDSYIVISNAGL